MTDAANWARVKAVFQQALDLSAAEREAFVSRECGEDKELHDEVQSMLAAMVAHTTRLQGDARDLLDGPSDAPPLPPIIDVVPEIRRIRRTGSRPAPAC